MLKKDTQQEVIERFNNEHGIGRYDYSLVEYINSMVKVKIICPIHGIFEQAPSNHINGSGCPACSESKGERAIRKYLEEKCIQYDPQYQILGSPISRKKFDFSIHEGLIEFQGHQHYIPSSFGSKKDIDGISKFKKNIKSDLLKENYCIQNNIDLIQIPYWEIDRIPIILDAFINKQYFKFKNPPKRVQVHNELKNKIRIEILKEIKLQKVMVV